MRVSLIYPPDGMLPSVPFASLPAVAACLREHGHEVTIHDLNLELTFDILRREKLVDWYAQAREVERTLGEKPELSAEERHELWRLQRLLAVPPRVFDKVEDALEVLNDRERFLDPQQFNPAFDDLRSSQRLALGLNARSFTESHGKPEEVLGASDAALPDPPVEFLQRTADAILAEKPEVIAVTMPWNTSIFYGMKLLRLIKERAPEIPVILGGSGLDSHHFQVLENPAWFDVFDFALEGRAEEQLPVLMKALETGGDPSETYNLFTRGADGRITRTESRLVENLNTAPTPDFSGLRLNDYLLPDPVATFQTSLGCYYGKCTFCSELFRKNFRMRRPDLVVDDMVKIHEETGITRFQIWDSLAPPKTLKRIAQEIIKRQLPFQWMAETKFEKPYLSDSMVETLAKGGCVFLFFGFESGSSRVLDLIDKGNNLQDVDQILDNLRKHDIRACTSWFIGFPGETEEEADTTYDFVALRRDRILFSNYTRTFGMGTDTIVFEQAERYGIEVIEDEHGALDYRYADGTPHWDQSERDEAFRARGDFHQINNHVEVHYSSVEIERGHQLTGQARMGPLLRHVLPEQLQSVRFRRTPECSLTEFARHPERPLDANSGFTMAYNVITGHAFDVPPEALALLDALHEPTSLPELEQRLGHPAEVLLPLLDLAVNRGILRIECDEDQLHYRPEAALKREFVAV